MGDADLFHYEELEPVQVKGKAKPLPVWRAVAARSRLGWRWSSGRRLRWSAATRS